MSIHRSRPTSAFAAIVQLHATTRLISASSNDHPLHLRLEHTSYRHRPSSWRPNITTTNFTRTSVITDNKLSSLLYLLPRLCFLHCLWLSLLARIKLKFICEVDTLIGSATTSSSKNSDDGLKASYNISLLIAKAGKPTLLDVKKK